jgi:hypothetical protein
MKSKNFKKKLTLNKKTVADLNIDEMADIHGGGDAPRQTIIFVYCSEFCNMSPTC